MKQGLPKEKLHAFVTGQVQGVGFRYFVKRNADALSLTGFVRNLQEGQVEVMAEGSHTSLEQLLTLLDLGPSGAVVIDVRSEYSAATGQYHEFWIETNI
jgi:acylphosphatase